MKNPTIATLLNFIPGLGYIYLGGKRRIFGILILSALAILFISPFFDPSFIDTEYTEEWLLSDTFVLVGITLYVGGFMYDAYVSANEYNESLAKKK